MRTSVEKIKSAPTVRTSLLRMVWACFVPGLLAGVLFLVCEYRDGHAELQEDTIRTARTMVQLVDSQLAQGELLAQTLVTSDAMVRRDFARFHLRIQRLLQNLGFVECIAIYDASGQQILNSQIPWGQPLPRRTDLKQLQQVFSQGKPARPEVLMGSMSRKPLVSIAVPVFAEEKVEYVLVIGMPPDVFHKTLTKQGLPPEWVTAIFDGEGTIAARNLSPESTVGTKVVAELSQYLAQAPEGSHDMTSREGIEVVAPYSRSAKYGWGVAIGIPRGGLEAPLWKNLLLLAISASLLLALSMGSVWFFGGRIAASLLALRAFVTALGNGDQSPMVQLHIQEADEVAQAMANTAAMLSARDRALSTSHEALVKSELRYRTLVEDSPEAITVHRDGVVLYTNKACVKMFGANSSADLVGKSSFGFVHPDFREATRERLRALALLGELSPLTELKFIKLDGTVIDGESQSTITLFDGMPAIQTYVRDTSERIRQTSELGALRTEMHTMMEWQVARHTVAALAHEINQPLASISMLCAAASRMAQSDTARLEPTLQRLSAEIERAGAVVRQLVQTVAQPDIARAPISLNELLLDVAMMAHDEAAFNCQIHICSPSNLKPVMANSLQISKVLMNLIGNAAQAMASANIAKGRIWIEARPSENGTMVDVSVRDEGPGIGADLEQDIFQPFITTKSDGLGMGLTISRALIEAHQGKLWLEVPATAGATFHFTLPISS